MSKPFIEPPLQDTGSFLEGAPKPPQATHMHQSLFLHTLAQPRLQKYESAATAAGARSPSFETSGKVS